MDGRNARLRVSFFPAATAMCTCSDPNRDVTPYGNDHRSEYHKQGFVRLLFWNVHQRHSPRLFRRSGVCLIVCIFICIFPRHTIAQQQAEGGPSAPAFTEVKKDSAEEFPSSQPELEWHSMITNIPGDWERYIQRTFRPSNVEPMVGMVLLTGALAVTDQQTWTMSRSFYRGSATVKDVSDFFEYLGDGRPQFGLAGAFAAYGFAFGDHRALRTASEVVEAILACGTVVQVLKHVTGRESPFVSTRDGGRWDFFPNQIQYHKHVPHYDAYPSGHIATALATVTVVAENYPEWGWVKPIGYPIVALIGISMANTGIHWYSDYPLGLALGYAYGMLAAHPEGLPDEMRGDGPGLSFAPVISSSVSGISISYTF